MRILLGACLGLVVVFILSGPWSLGPYVLRDVNLTAGAALVIAALGALTPAGRRFYVTLLRQDIVLSRRFLLAAFTLAGTCLLSLVWSKYAAMQVNAWDFSTNFDRPIERTLRGTLMHSEEWGRSMLGIHATWLSFAFVPFYALRPSPLWLLAAQALAVAGGAAAAFAFFRHETTDDFIAITLAGAFLFNRYTAKATQYVFHAEIFYPLGLFLLYYAFVRGRRAAFAAALILLLSIKEDALIPIAGFGLVAGVIYRRWRWAVTAVGAAIVVFVLDYYVVMPRFWPTGTGAWYANYWQSFGDTPMSALAGMLRHPLRVMERVVSGSADVFISLALVPLLGVQWLLGAVPGLIVYGSADMDKLHWFTMYYSMPVLPAIFAAIPAGIRRLSQKRIVARCCAVAVLVASISVGSGFVVDASHPDRRGISQLVAQSDGRTWVQGAIFPHAGYSPRLHVLNERARVDGESAFLLCATADPYPYRRDELDELTRRLSADRRYERVAAGTIVLFVARDQSPGSSPGD